MIVENNSNLKYLLLSNLFFDFVLRLIIFLNFAIFGLFCNYNKYFIE